MPEVTRSELHTAAPPHRVYEAWTEPERISQWFADRAEGWPGAGGKLTMTWERFGFTVDYHIAEADPGRRLVLKTKIPGIGTSAVEIDLKRRGEGTVLKIVETGPEPRLGEEETGEESGWEMALSVLKLYLEEHWGQTRHSFFAMLPAEFEYPRVHHLYSTLEGLKEWFAVDGEMGGVGEPCRFSLPDGRTLSGYVMARTPHEAAYRWSEVGGYLEMKSFPLGEPGKKAVCLRGGAWGITPELTAECEKLCQESLVRLYGALAARVG